MSNETETTTEETATSLIGGAEDETTTEEEVTTSTEETTEEETTTETTDDETETEETVEPLTADSFTIPEGVEVSEELLGGFTELMNDDKMSRAELAQGIIDLQIESTQTAMESAQEAAQTLWTDTQTEWQDAIRADPEMGGENWDKTAATIKKGMESVGATKETFAALDLTGAGNHPEIVRVLHALTKKLVEGGPVRGNQTQAPRSQADRMFGSGQS